MQGQVVILVGPMAGGKTEATRALTQEGFIPFSLSQLVRKQAGLRRGILPIKLQYEEVYRDIARSELQQASMQLRDMHGQGALAKIMVHVIQRLRETGKIPEGANIVIEGVRSEDEMLFLQKELHATAIGVTASADKRWERLQTRNRPGDPQTREEFNRIDSYEWQRVGKSLQLCDPSQVIDNSQLGLAEARQRLFAILGIVSPSPEGNSLSKEQR